ncbi:MAG: chromosome segregation protein SMC [Gammaproteobacteria bacterium]|nr:chromosome segregation protein SMC [Gammaproteobacteria bacterium]NIM73491.1 chromosome segregation protein SMC [Gammaproteobacteria bacterium]NIN39900.1 chromosome segregation protein SMC [Gammaproteobacteria bacterium]NIO25300.1 chromosome segregation protein SMC [Gammaproteobacteria bacterium]NIO65927.1 chromosome segregation protein SMC [Gammaproteobacteria bacterium]
MRLKRIRLAGFKSFVDPITIHVPGELTAVVGPNGCGKSNIIDAVRWVMGELSAKHLRGDSMADVVFTGSNTRKPVGQASVELIFDNSGGRLGGRYASYSEISVKRQVSRDSQSAYFLNGTRCRRRDVTDVFFGTGLGPRSYAIIEQGMISRLIEARPEELRDFLEEAAGISKYKERRRETENRMRHAEENLERLTDLRDELGKRLAHLKRQATMAGKYKVLKQEERDLEAELLALRWRGLDAESRAKTEAVTDQETALEAGLAEQRRVEAELEKARSDQSAVAEAFNEVYRRVLDAESAIARGEETIQNLRRQREEQRENLSAEEQRLESARMHLESEAARSSELRSELGRLEPELERLHADAAEARVGFRASEEAMHAWQSDWESWSEEAAEPARMRDAEAARIQHLVQAVAQLEQRRDRLRGEQAGLPSEALERSTHEQRTEIERAERHLVELERAVAARQEELNRARDVERAAADTLHEAREGQQSLGGRLSALQALQQDALGKRPGVVMEWLRETGLAKQPRLAEQLNVDSKWARAVEMVLDFRLEAVCVDSLEHYARALQGFSEGALTLFEGRAGASLDARVAGSLAERVEAPWSLAGVLAGVRTAETLSEALAVRAALAAHESVVTPEGVWVGPSWIRVHRVAGEDSGVLAREQELHALAEEFAGLQARVEACEAELADSRTRRDACEAALAAVQADLAAQLRARAALESELGAATARHEQARERAATISAECQDVETQLAAEQEVLARARSRWEQSSSDVERLNEERADWMRRREEHRQRLDESREAWQAAREQAYELGLKAESMRAQAQSLDEGRARNLDMVAQLEARVRDQRAALEAGSAPLAEAEAALEEKLKARSLIDESLRSARERVESAEGRVRALDETRLEKEERVNGERTRLESLRLEAQEVSVRRRTVEEQFARLGYELPVVLECLQESATVGEWEEKLAGIERRINRLGPINLAAIEEHEQHAERKQYLDAQHQDLQEALETLSAAIQKIDRETRARFKETYEKVNEGLGAMFPRLFGGGTAYLQLTGDDLLSTGVSVMARPPGKRNTSIHLLSGGEKALAAIALVFAIFELNPAPFCLLDEVDAPLDDVNAVRFSELLKDMSERVQFVIVTHNKITMEIAEQLIGVTMNEPGVSRLVAVDVDEAVELVAV